MPPHNTLTSTYSMSHPLPWMTPSLAPELAVTAYFNSRTLAGDIALLKGLGTIPKCVLVPLKWVKPTTGLAESNGIVVATLSVLVVANTPDCPYGCTKVGLISEITAELFNASANAVSKLVLLAPRAG